MTEQELINRFTYHPPKGDQAERYEQIRAKALEFALLIKKLTPASREQSIAITKLEDVAMTANKAIAVNEVTDYAREPTFLEGSGEETGSTKTFIDSVAG